MDLTYQLQGELKRLGRSVNVSVKMNPDGSIVALKNGGYFMTLEQSRNKAACYGSSSVRSWANKIDSHLGKCSRGDYHRQYEEIEKQNRDMKEKQNTLRREDLIRDFEKAREDARRGRVYYT